MKLIYWPFWPKRELCLFKFDSGWRFHTRLWFRSVDDMNAYIRRQVAKEAA